MKITSKARFVAAAAIGCSAVIVAILSFNSKPTDFPENTAGSDTTISITSGETGSQIAHAIERLGVVKSATAFIKLEMSEKSSQSISPGVHTLQTHITSKEALAQLLDPARNKGLVRVVEGSTVTDVLSALRNAGIHGERKSVPIPVGYPSQAKLEGFLFPSTYAFAEGISVDDALKAMVHQFSLTSSTLALNKGYGSFSPYQVLTIASLVQIEGDPQDYAKISRVIYNRLAISMPLQLNSSVQYALNQRGKINLSRGATHISSPYNTYQHTGLPPSPISNPGAAAISGALHPATGDWLYFITVRPHDTRFTNNFKEFEGWVTLYNNNVANGAFK